MANGAFRGKESFGDGTTSLMKKMLFQSNVLSKEEVEELYEMTMGKAKRVLETKLQMSAPCMPDGTPKATKITFCQATREEDLKLSRNAVLGGGRPPNQWRGGRGREGGGGRGGGGASRGGGRGGRERNRSGSAGGGGGGGRSLDSLLAEGSGRSGGSSSYALVRV